MIEGWHKSDYLILFEEQIESLTMTERYDAKLFLPGYTIVGLKGWDNFILVDVANRFYTSPTVPLAARHLNPFTFSIDLSTLRLDSRVAGRIKWYIQPLIFGGDPKSEQNTAWLTIEEHIEVVKFWNKKYTDIVRSQDTTRHP